MKKQKPYWEMNTEELAHATKEFDDPNHNPTAIKPTATQKNQLQRWQHKRAAKKTTLTNTNQKSRGVMRNTKKTAKTTKPSRRRGKLSELMAKFKPKHRHGEWNLGNPVGKETW